MSNPFDNNFFGNIFTQAFNQPFFQQNPFADNNRRTTTNTSTNNFFNGVPFFQQQGNSSSQSQTNSSQAQQSQAQQQPQPQPQQQQQHQHSQQQQSNQHPTYHYANNNIFRQNKKSQNPQYQQHMEEKLSKASENQGQYWKLKGNQAFSKGNYELAIKHYTKAIEIDDTESVYFSNRARCYRQLKQYENCLKDAQTAMELDDKNIKSYMLCGQSLAQLSKGDNNTQRIQNAIQKLMKSLSLSAGQGKIEFEKELICYILRAKKLLWYKQREMDQQIIKECKEKIQQSFDLNKAMSEIEKQQYMDIVLKNLETPKTAQKDFNIPDHLICKITLDIMSDPYITPSGVTYNGQELKDHIDKNGSTDPVTREHIDTNMIYPNISIKNAVREFIETNPWAWEYSSTDNYKEIEF